MDHLCYFCLALLCFHIRLFVGALWSPDGKWLTSWLSFVVSIWDVVTFQFINSLQFLTFKCFNLRIEVRCKSLHLGSNPASNLGYLASPGQFFMGAKLNIGTP